MEGGGGPIIFIFMFDMKKLTEISVFRYNVVRSSFE